MDVNIVYNKLRGGECENKEARVFNPGILFFKRRVVFKGSVANS